MDAAPDRTAGTWRAVAWSMGLGAAYDLCFAAAILLFAEPAGRLLGIAVPDDPTYFRLNGIFLILLAGLYVLPALAPRRYRGVVAVAAGGRLLGAIYLGAVWWAGGPPAFAGLAGGDLLLAVVHAALLWRVRGAATAGRP